MRHLVKCRIPLSLIVLILALALQTAAVTTVSAACIDLVINGGFENLDGWRLGASPIPPQYVGTPVHGGSRAMRLGNSGLPNQLSYSSVRQQVSLPAGITSAEISFWVWTTSETAAGADRQELLLLVPGAHIQSAPIAVLWRGLFNSPSWTQIRLDLKSYAGQTFDVYFNVFNDGQGGRSAMVIDDVTLTVCQDATPTATPTPTGAPGAPVTWVGNLNPDGAHPQVIDAGSRLPISVQVYAPGVTDPPGQGGGVACWLHYGRVAAFGGPWSDEIDAPMSYAGDAGPNDRYGLRLGPLAAGFYEYTAWCSGDGGQTRVWADIALGGNGKITVVGVAPTATRPSPPPYPSPHPPPYPPPHPPPHCSQLLVNGDFEKYAGWHLGRTPRQPAYAAHPAPVISGYRSMRLGADPPDLPDVASYSSVRQTVTIPYWAHEASISFWYYPISEDSPGGIDYQELILLDPHNLATLKILWRTTENDRTWKPARLDLTRYRGRSIVIYFNARNDGDGKRTAMYLDDVRLQACQPMPAPPPMPPPLPSPPPPPASPPSLPPPLTTTSTPTPFSTATTPTATPTQTATPTTTPVREQVTPTLFPESRSAPGPSPDEATGLAALLNPGGGVTLWVILCGLAIIVLGSVVMIVRLATGAGRQS